MARSVRNTAPGRGGSPSPPISEGVLPTPSPETAPTSVARHRRWPTTVIRLRRLSQILFLGFFLYLFGLTTLRGFVRSPVPVDLFLRADPLGAISSMIAGRQFLLDVAITAGVILVLTVFLGRVFCGWICPLGVCIDVFDRLFFRPRSKSRKHARSETRRFGKLKYWILVACLAGAVLGLPLTFFFDPISLLTRSLTLSVLPLLNRGYDAGFQWAAGAAYSHFDLDISRWAWAPVAFRQGWIVFLIFAAVIGLSAYQERFWCRNLCPLGGLLGLCSRWSLLRHAAGEGCNRCQRCEWDSRMGAYENMGRKAEQPPGHDVSECIHCFRCFSTCAVEDLTVKWNLPRRKPGPSLLEQAPLDLSRRRLLHAAFWGVALAGLLKAAPKASATGMRRIRPPGALPEPDFLGACIRCGECMKVCPTNGLQPAFAEAGIEGFWTPVLVPRIGPCTELCVACGEVCPTDALKPFTFEQKRDDIRLGLAVVDQDLCVAYNGGRDCIVCAEVCSYLAVIFKDEFDAKLGRNKRVPTVDEIKCTGCGICEKYCPVGPEAAIVIYTTNERRLGEYPGRHEISAGGED